MLINDTRLHGLALYPESRVMFDKFMRPLEDRLGVLQDRCDESPQARIVRQFAAILEENGVSCTPWATLHLLLPVVTFVIYVDMAGHARIGVSLRHELLGCGVA
jgi:hypothetical protein